MSDPQPFSDVDLLAWSVVLAYRGLQQKQGLTILLLPFPPCPTCGGVVHGADSATVERGVHWTATLTLRPCGHVHTATDDDVHRVLLPHQGDMIEAMEQADRGDRAWTTGDVIRNARDCAGAPPEPLSAPRSVPEASGGELAGRDGDSGPQAGAGGSGWTQLEARAFNAVQPSLRQAGEWLPLTARRAVARAVLAELEPDLDRLQKRADGNWAMLQLMERERNDWGDRHRAVSDQLARARELHQQNCLLATGAVKPTAFTCGMCDALTEPPETP